MRYINDIVFVNNCYLVKPIEGELKSASGIMLEAGVSDAPSNRGIVVATPLEEPLGIKVGDLVYYDKYAGINTKGDLSADNYIVLGEKQIIAFVAKSKHSEQV